VQIILYHGYPVQVFHAHTSDGYILDLHRIPFGKNGYSISRKYRPAIFLQHGLLGSSADWVENYPNESFGNYIKIYWDEMAKYDLDAMFDVVLKITKQKSLYYVGFSQGTLIMFVKLSQDPNFASKIRKFFALAPVATVANVKGLFRLFATKMFPNAKSRLSVYIGGEGGTSVMNIIHWVQMINSGKLQAYNYESVEENQRHYGSVIFSFCFIDSPPIYNISSVNVPIYLYWSLNDWLANTLDIEWPMFITIIFKFFVYTKLYHLTNGISIKSLPEATMTTNEIIAYYGYPSETHTVTTDDGYILELHRIPGGKAGNSIIAFNNSTMLNGITTSVIHANYSKNESKSVVFLQHGFIGSSAVWVTNLPNQSAAFLFADAGFDVWMGNVRGNTYSTKHVEYTQNDLKYWKFTSVNFIPLLVYYSFRFDEFAKYDLDSMINYVLNETSQQSLYYIGYSEGTLTMFAKLSIDQLFAQKIRKFFALGPIGTLTYINGLVRVAGEKFLRPLKMLVKITGKFMPNESIFQKISKSTCSLKSIVEHCENLMFQMTGPATIQMNVSRIPIYMSHLPAGTSMANVLHWAQMVNSHKTQMYDYGSENKNMKHYNMKTPPLYNLSLVNAPVYLYWSEKDWLADKRDIQDSLVAKIPSKYLIQNNELQDFNHFDFIWGIHAADKIYKPIIEIIRNDETKL
ncbi:unnamed protein product, partial [Wuchereria bancrofti]